MAGAASCMCRHRLRLDLPGRRDAAGQCTALSALVAVALAILAMPTLAAAMPARAPRPPVVEDIEPMPVNQPLFPVPEPYDRFRLWVNSLFVPPSDFGEVDMGVAIPQIRLRADVPLGRGASFQLTGEFRSSIYDTDGSGLLFSDCPGCPSSPGTLYQTTIAAQSGFLLNDDRHLIRAGENWVLLGALYARARWEPGALGDSITPGVNFGIGYQLPAYLRIAIGGRVERALDGDGVKIGPSGQIRWDFLPNWQAQTRGYGLQIEYTPRPRIELFVTGYRSTDRFRLDDRSSLGRGLTFRDRSVLVGGGVAVKILRQLRARFEAGAAVNRSVSVSNRGDGKLDSTDGDAAPYISFRVELRR